MTIEQTIAKAIDTHRRVSDTCVSANIRGMCAECRNGPWTAEHAAGEVVKALQLTRRDGLEDLFTPTITEFWHCWATPWVRTCTCPPPDYSPDGTDRSRPDEHCPIHEGRS